MKKHNISGYAFALLFNTLSNPDKRLPLTEAGYCCIQVVNAMIDRVEKIDPKMMEKFLQELTPLDENIDFIQFYGSISFHYATGETLFDAIQKGMKKVKVRIPTTENFRLFLLLLTGMTPEEFTETIINIPGVRI